MTTKYSIFDTLLEPVFVLNQKQEVVYCNETAATVAGVSLRKITRGMHFNELFAFADTFEYLKDIQSIQDPTPYRETNFQALNGDAGKSQITIQPTHNPEGETHWLIFFRDVTLEERLQKKYRAELEKKENVIEDLEIAKSKLQDYSRNLENKVAERTAQLSQMNSTLSALLDSLGQGFFIFRADGKVLDIASKACLNTIEKNPSGLMIWDALNLGGAKVDGFQKWMEAIFGELLPFEDLACLAPTTYEHSGGKKIALEYYPIFTEASNLESIVVVASDITDLVEAQQEAEREKEYAKLIIHMIKSKREVSRFIKEATSMISNLLNEVNKDTDYNLNDIFRYLHTLKGGAALFSIKAVAESCHNAETVLAELRESWSAAGLVDLRSRCLEVNQNFQSFLNDTQSIMGKKNISPERQVEIAISTLNKIAQKVGQLPGGGDVAEKLLLQLIMEPAGRFVEPYNEVVTNLSLQLGKEVNPIVINNPSIMIIPEIYSRLFSTLVHAFRNAMDHGIETSEHRSQNGKNPVGTITATFNLITQGKGIEHLQICIADDGAGISPDKIRGKMNGLNIPHAHESDDQVIQHIFDSHFSTREQVTDLSGRGMGMDAIKHEALALNGKVWVESAVGRGSSIYIEVPYKTECEETLYLVDDTNKNEDAA